MILIATKLHPTIIGGVEKVVKQYAEVLAKNEIVWVLTFADVKYVTFERVGKILIISVPRYIKYRSYSFSLVYFGLLLRCVRKARVVNLHAPFPVFHEAAAFLAKRKYIVTFHSEIVSPGIVSKILNISQKLFLRRATTTIVTSDFYKEKLYKFHHGNVSVIPLWLEKSSEHIDGQVFLDLPKRYVLFLGRFGRYKGLKVLQDAIVRAKLGDINFVIAGSGDYLPNSLKNMNNVKLIKRFVSEAEKLELIRRCEFFLFPSTDSGEAFGLMQLEAMREGKAIINTNLQSGVPMVSRHEQTGLTVPVNDPVAAGLAIRKLYQDEGLNDIYGAAAKHHYQANFDKKKSVSKLTSLFKKKSLMLHVS